MHLKLNTKKTIQQSANEYFEAAKKFRKKAEGATLAIAKFSKELSALEHQESLIEETKQQKSTAPKDWYDKFRWFISSEGFLCIGGRDATTNEIIIKKHTDAHDLVFHTEAAGSPFFVIKTEGKTPSDETIQETADAAASFSKAWKLGTPAAEVYSVSPSQVSRTAESGEYLPKGAFMIRGKRTYMTGHINLAVGLLENGKIMCGPLSAVKKQCATFVPIKQGRDKPSDCAKTIAKKLNAHVDDVLRALPSGGCEVK